jgi:hypothetical protein
LSNSKIAKIYVETLSEKQVYLQRFALKGCSKIMPREGFAQELTQGINGRV